MAGKQKQEINKKHMYTQNKPGVFCCRPPGPLSLGTSPTQGWRVGQLEGYGHPDHLGLLA